MSGLDDSYVKIFVNEVFQYIDNLNKLILDLEKKRTNIALAEEIMRIAHSVKGMAATMEYTSLASVSHDIETLLTSEIEKGEVRPEVIDPLFAYTDKLQEFANIINLGSNISDIDMGDLVEKVADLDEIALNLGKNLELVVRFDPSTRMKSVRAFMVLQNLEAVAKIITSDPTKHELEEGALLNELVIEISTKESEDIIKENVLSVTDVLDVTFNYLLGERQEVEEEDIQVASEVQRVRVSLADLDEVMNLLAELMIIRGSLGTGTEIRQEVKMHSDVLSRMDAIIFDIQEKILNLRMVPLEHIFSRFPRMIRDLAQKEGKKIDLSTLGKHIELDRSVIDPINEILLHLIRNSVSHGIEAPDKRLTLGKPETGKIRIIAKQERDGIQVDLEDDGIGIDMEEIRQKAVETGLLAEDHTPTRAELTKILFSTGFTTRQETDLISGRGYGLNIVWKAIEKINGSISIRTKKNIGTQFSIKLPLTIAITQALLIEDNGQKYGVPLNNVQSILRVEQNKVSGNEEGGKYIFLDDDVIVPLIELKKCFRGDEKEETETKPEAHTVIIWEKGGKRLGLSVENLIGQQDIVIKEMDEIVSKSRGFSGASILGDGEIVLIIDPESLKMN